MQLRDPCNILSPIAKECEKPLVMNECMDASYVANCQKRLVEITPASMRPLTVATIKNTSKLRRRNSLSRRHLQIMLDTAKERSSADVSGGVIQKSSIPSLQNGQSELRAY
ncbi:hypothetical protein SEMRO_2273_G321490.1 [Seminavis robusta]|uniref:Uncharacterized protein n=1 Tax=Seminavis robusta TaxID=568900 RepID=A0A9N8EZ51_9STRA|nr:hypothetical protein SEMRO_2273_G321490.1 [Seminavis robusta]|eukprot:Sro2273_g321490.1 n/a (111) ;mRNA; r:213-545